MFGIKNKIAVDTNPEKISELLTRGVEEIIDKDRLESKLRSGKQLRIKLGIDPTSPNIHIGRTVPLLKLRDFQELGHKVVLIIGDFTGLIGDTSDKESERPMLREDQVKKNMESYIKQAAKVIDVDKCEIHYNSEWLGKLGYEELGRQADVFSLSDFVSRENIKKRLDAGRRVSLRELLYPLMQGYDSVAIKADVELGGTDQRFNLLAGRDLQRDYKQEPQDIITNPLLEGLDGRKMSSSWGNVIDLFDLADDMYGKVMSLKDDFIIKYFVLTTRIDLKTIEDYKKSLKSGTNPKDIKIKLAYEIVKMYHSDREAKQAEENFVNTFVRGDIPEDTIEVSVARGVSLSEILLVNEVVVSKSDFRRLVSGGAITNMDTKERVTDFNAVVSGGTYKIGKRRFLKIKVL
jgi:tyrosyl-tRNA synthetase